MSPHVPRAQKLRHAAVHGAEQVELRELPDAVKFCKFLQVIQALLEVALVHQVVKPGGIFEKFPHRLRRFPPLSRALCGHEFGFGIKIDHHAVLEKIPPQWGRTGTDGEVVGHFPVRPREQPFENMRQCENRRARDRSCSRSRAGHSACLRSFRSCHTPSTSYPLLGERDCGGETAQARTNDYDLFCFFSMCLLSLLALYFEGQEEIADIRPANPAHRT